MSNVININQFAPTPVKGDIDLSIAESQTISCQVDSSQATALVAGQPVKLTTAVGALPVVIAAGQTDVAFGFIKRTVQAASFNALDKVEVVGQFGPVMWLESAAAIAAGARVEDASGDLTVQTFTSNKVRGVALDAATAANQLLRVIITTPVTALA